MPSRSRPDLPLLSVVLACYNMARELPRTIRSVSADMQREISAADYEVIVVDNGSTDPFDVAACRAWIPALRVMHFPGGNPSPVQAINAGISAARGDLIGVLIDGARLASPRLLALSLAAARLHPRAVIGSLGFHLGPDEQQRTVPHGYTQAVEDELLRSVDWTRDGYRLFEISSFAGSSASGWFLPLAETNALFMARALWQELGGYDPAFRLPGGGLANLDIWSRAVSLPASQVIVLLGEGTFHQVHGGVSTNARRSVWPELAAEYRQIRGTDFQRPRIAPVYWGGVPRPVLDKLAWSVEQARAAGNGDDPG
ncbi:MAG: glycosyltransferase family 2 protein [Chromatiaceae bacterium]|nr:MAG: glycosyltransferase family 2 protein [Chromatiaceae bacterium]